MAASSVMTDQLTTFLSGFLAMASSFARAAQTLRHSYQAMKPEKLRRKSARPF